MTDHTQPQLSAVDEDLETYARFDEEGLLNTNTVGCHLLHNFVEHTLQAIGEAVEAHLLLMEVRLLLVEEQARNLSTRSKWQPLITKIDEVIAI